jgi:phosphohistidine phosphatase SixA
MSDSTSFRAGLRHGFLLLLPLLSAIATAHGESLSGKDLLTALRTGGYVILMRHASSPNTPPEPAEANADNVEHERQLDEVGRSSARAMGEALHRLRIPIDQVLSSPTYRALETVKLAQLGQASTFSQLGDSDHSMLADNSGARAAWLKAKAAQPPMSGKNTIIVTHFSNIKEAYPQSAAGIADGEALVLHPDGRRGAPIVARVKIDEWARLDAVP